MDMVIRAARVAGKPKTYGGEHMVGTKARVVRTACAFVGTRYNWKVYQVSSVRTRFNRVLKFHTLLERSFGSEPDCGILEPDHSTPVM
jgi:hypothetical protein